MAAAYGLPRGLVEEIEAWGGPARPAYRKVLAMDPGGGVGSGQRCSLQG